MTPLEALKSDLLESRIRIVSMGAITDCQIHGSRPTRDGTHGVSTTATNHLSIPGIETQLENLRTLTTQCAQGHLSGPTLSVTVFSMSGQRFTEYCALRFAKERFFKNFEFVSFPDFYI